jgi:hypothetical protein
MTEFENELMESPDEEAAPVGKTGASAKSNGKGKKAPAALTRTVELPYPCLGIDLGTTGTRGAIGEDISDNEQVVCLPSPVVEVEADECRDLELDSDLGTGQLELEKNLKFIFQGKGYLVGQAAIDAGAVLSPGVSKLDYAGPKLGATSIMLGLRGSLAVCFCIPFLNAKQYKSDRISLVETYQEQRLDLHVIGEDYFIYPEQVYVLPEGAAPLYLAQRQGARFSGRKGVVLDGGHWTLDCTLLEYDKRSDSIQFNPTASVSLPAGMHQFAEMVASHPDLQIPSKNSPRLIQAIANGDEFFQYKTSTGLRKVQLAKYVSDLKPKFLKKVIGDILDWFPDTEIDDVHLVGGMCDFFKEELQKLFHDGGYSTNLIHPPRIASALSQHLFCQQMVAKSLI